MLVHHGELVQITAAGRRQRGLAGGEQHLGLEHEAVAHHFDVGIIGEHFAQAAKEVAGVFLQFLDPLQQLLLQGAVQRLDPALLLDDHRVTLGQFLLVGRQGAVEPLQFRRQPLGPNAEQRRLFLHAGRGLFGPGFVGVQRLPRGLHRRQFGPQLRQQFIPLADGVFEALRPTAQPRRFLLGVAGQPFQMADDPL